MVCPYVGVELVHGEALNKKVLDSVLVSLFNCRTNRVDGSLCCVYIEVVVAVDTCDLLDDVSLDGNVLCCSPGGNGNCEIVAAKLNCEAESLESIHDSIV